MSELVASNIVRHEENAFVKLRFSSKARIRSKESCKFLYCCRSRLGEIARAELRKSLSVLGTHGENHSLD